MVCDWICGNWKQLIGPMQEKWGKLTHNDLVVAAGEHEQLVELLREHYGYPKAQAESELDEFTRIRKSEVETEVYECVPQLSFESYS